MWVLLGSDLSPKMLFCFALSLNMFSLFFFVVVNSLDYTVKTLPEDILWLRYESVVWCSEKSGNQEINVSHQQSIPQQKV